MAPVKFERVVSYSSEDPNQPAENLAKDGAYRKWRCKLPGEPKAWVELQLEKMSMISAVDIGNHGSAFIEVLVGRSGCSEEDYKVLLNSASFMTPQECRNETNLQRVRIFKYQDLNKAAQTEKWDRIRVVCTQPFNKQLQYGLSFVTIHAPEEEAPKTQSNGTTSNSSNLLGAFKLREEPTFDPVKQSVFFSRFQSPRVSSVTTQPGTIRAASQSLAAIALAQSEQEAISILRKTPTKKDGRPEIKLTDKLKESQSQSPTASKTAFAKAQEQSPLPSRKEVESDRPKPPVTPTTPVAARTPIRKKEERKVKPSTPQEVKREAPVKRKTPPPSHQPDDSHRLVKKPRTTKPFNRLLEGDVVVLSGFQNPLRSQLRDKLLALGAVYKPDWNASCTHLICAFYNTPKFREVKGKGKIVTKNWVEDCYSKRRRFPWRRYCLDRNDKKEESEDEIWAGEDEVASSPVTAKPGASNIASRSHSNVKTVSSDVVSKSNLVQDEDDYGGSTEVDEVDTDDEIDKIKKKIIEEQAIANKSQPLDFFSGSNFFLGKDLSDETKDELTNCIKNFQGKIIPKLRSKVTHFITDNPDDDSLAKAQSKNENMKIIKTDWIRKCEKLQKYISPDEFTIVLSK